jgi:hypothetical protein
LLKIEPEITSKKHSILQQMREKNENENSETKERKNELKG